MKTAPVCLAVCGAAVALGAGLSIRRSPGAIRFSFGAIHYLRNRIPQLPRLVEAAVTLGRLVVKLTGVLAAAAFPTSNSAVALVVGFFRPKQQKLRVVEAVKILYDDALLLEIVNRLTSVRDVGRLAGVSKRLRDDIRRCLPASKWPVVAGGKICEPRSFHAVALHKDRFDGIVTAIKRAPLGGSVLIEPGEYVMPSQLGCFGGGAAHIFGRREVIIRAEDPTRATAFMQRVVRRGSFHRLIFAPVNGSTQNAIARRNAISYVSRSHTVSEITVTEAT